MLRVKNELSSIFGDQDDLGVVPKMQIDVVERQVWLFLDRMVRMEETA